MVLFDEMAVSRRSLFGGAAAVTAATVLGAPSHQSTAQAEPAPAAEQVVKVGADANPLSIDPASAFEGGSLNIVRAAYEGLVAQVIGTTDIAPALATEWVIADDATAYTFTLREGVKFSDGTDLDAEAVKKSYDRTIALGLGPASLLSGVSSVNVVDPLTVEIVLSEPNAYFLAYVPKIGIVSPTAWESNQKDGDYGLDYIQNHTAGTGPYQLTELSRNERIVLERFPDYWRGWDGPHLDKIIFEGVPALETQRQQLVNGEIHFTGILADDVVAELVNEPNVQVSIWPTFETDILPINTQKAPTDDIRVRQAIQLAFDYQGYIDGVLLGNGTIPNGHLAPDFPGYDETLPPFSQDIEKAKALIEEAGVSGAKLTANYIVDFPTQEQHALILQDALGQIGLELEVKPLPWATMDSVVADLETADHISVLYMAAFTADPAFTLNQNYGSAFVAKPYNWSWYDNPEFQALVTQAQQTVDADESVSLLQQAQRILVADAPAVFYVHPQTAQAYSSKVQGFKWNPVDYRWTANWYDIWLSE